MWLKNYSGIHGSWIQFLFIRHFTFIGKLNLSVKKKKFSNGCYLEYFGCVSFKHWSFFAQTSFLSTPWNPWAPGMVIFREYPQTSRSFKEISLPSLHKQVWFFFFFFQPTLGCKFLTSRLRSNPSIILLVSWVKERHYHNAFLTPFPHNGERNQRQHQTSSRGF